MYMLSWGLLSGGPMIATKIPAPMGSNNNNNNNMYLKSSIQTSSIDYKKISI